MADVPFVAGVQFKAGGTIAPRRCVKLSTSTDFTVSQSGDAEKSFGISQDGMKRAPGLPGSDSAVAAESGDMIHVVGPGYVAFVEAGAAISTRDNLVKSDTNGQVVAHTSGTAWCIGRNLTVAGGANEVIKIWVNPQWVFNLS